MTRNELIENNIGLAHYISGKFYSMDRDDVVSTSYLGLIKAADTYDPTKGAAFATWATIVIKTMLLHEYRHKKRLSKHEVFDIEILEEQSAPDPCDLVVSLDAAKRIIKNLDCLKPRERVVLQGLGRGKSQKEIGQQIGVSQAHVSRIRKRVLNKWGNNS